MIMKDNHTFGIASFIISLIPLIILPYYFFLEYIYNLANSGTLKVLVLEDAGKLVNYSGLETEYNPSELLEN